MTVCILVCRGGVGRRAGNILRLALGRIGLGAALALVAGLSFTAPAAAATINTYSFTQEGYLPAGAVDSVTVQGTFSGLVEPDGLMNLAGLTGFQAFVSVHTGFGTANAVSVALPTFFSFNTLSSPNASGGNSSLAFFVMMSDDGYTTGQNLCVGSATFLKCGVSGVAGAYSSVPLTTTAYPHVTLVSSTAVTPIPAPILLFATALSGLGLLGAQARRRQRAA